MSTTIDERVVEMRFDNRQFENNVSTTMSTLDKLKQKLNLTGASKGLDDVNAAARNNGLPGLGAAVETVQAKFSALGVIGVTALANITNSAVNTGKRMISALTIDPIKTGFSEYETKINAIQTIMSNTASKGTTMEDVTRVIGDLNTYADKTIYNFAEMTRNIGTFTAAGVGLEESATAIQGIANLAAMSGSSSQQASTAMYQLSQAMASGTVKLMDWNSVVNAGMGGELFQNALKETARSHGVAVDEIIEAQGSFRESLTEGWITTDILTETLAKMTKSGASEYLSNLTGIEQDQITAAQKLVAENKDGKASYEELAETLAATGKITKEKAMDILKMADNAEDAATKIKTFTQLWDTLKESAQSGWSQTWEILIGDFEEAKETLTEISKVIGGVIEESAKARNELLQGWKDAGGRADLVDSLFNVFKAIGSIVKPIKEAFREIFPPITVKQLKSFTEGIKEFTEKLTISSETAEKVKRIFKGVFSILDIGKKIVSSVADAIAKLFGSDGVGDLATFLLDVTAALGDFFTKLNEGFDSSSLTSFLTTLVDLVSDLIEGSIGPIRSFGDAIAAVGNFIVNVAKKIWDGVKPVFDWLRENISAGDIFAGLAGGGIFVAAKKLSGFLDKIVDTLKNIFGKDSDTSSIKEKFGEVLDSVKESLNSFSLGVKISSLISIAIAIGILSASLKTISEIKLGDAVKSLTAIGIMMGMLSLTFKSITKVLDNFKPTGLIKAGVSLVLVATAINILAKAMEKIGALPLKNIAKGLIGIGGGLAALSVGLKIIGKTKISLKTSIAIIALAQACKMLGDAMQKFAKLSWDEIGRGLAAMGGALAEFVAAIAILNKAGGFKSLFGSLGILIAVQSLEKMAEGLKSFAEMSWNEIGRGLAAMGGALGELGIVLAGVGKIAGFSSIFAAGSIWITTQGLSDLASALKSFAEMTWDEIGRGLSAMGGALAELGIVLSAVGKIAGLSSIFAAGSILITIQGLDDLAAALKKFGEMAWDEIGRGLTAMGGALAEVAGLSGALGKIAGFSGIFGAGTILITIQGLDDLATALKKFGEISWDEIGRGLVAMGGALLEVGGISGGLGVLAGFAGILGGAAIWTTVQGLEDLANSLKKFGEMSWDEIGRSLSAMGGALGEVALGGFLNTFALIGSISISEIASSLGDLADGVQKWKDVSVPEGLGTQLGDLAKGVEKFTFAGVGASALSESAAAVGVLADSVKKWNGVTIPEGLPSKFDTLSTAVRKFWDASVGDNTLTTIAKPFGDLADSVKKWNGVTVPENIETNLNSIANGVKAFSFAFAGGWSMSALVTPLGDLSGSIKKWVDVTVPENIETNLKGIANGVKAFSFAFAGGWSMSALVTPLGSLPDSISKWNGIAVPENIESNLKSIANGVKAFSFAFAGGWSIDAIITPLGNLPGAIKKWNGVTIPEGLGPSLKSLAEGVVPFANIGDISSAASSVSFLSTSLKTLSGVDISGLSSKLDGLASSISSLSGIDSVSTSISQLASTITSSFSNAISEMTNVGSTLISRLVYGIITKISLVYNTINNLVNNAILAFSDRVPMFKDVGIKLITGLANGITNKGTLAVSAMKIVVINIVGAARSKYTSFYDAGKYCVQGFVNGINNNSYLAAAAGQKIAAAALEAAKNALLVQSPSRAFYEVGNYGGIGFVNALKDNVVRAYRAGSKMAQSAMDGLGEAMSKVRNTPLDNIDIQPTIRPVLDLSNIQNGANRINGLFANQSLALAGINADFNTGTNGLINAISDLQKLNNTSNAEVLRIISELRGDFGDLINAISHLQVNLDGNTLVGELTGKIDNKLGKLATYKGRRN